jgi:hypothetical protein
MVLGMPFQGLLPVFVHLPIWQIHDPLRTDPSTGCINSSQARPMQQQVETQCRGG